LEKERKNNERFRIANIESVLERKRKWEEIERLMKPPKR
jgi:anaerobic glycerol-3-phosphate dehydrogenase